MPLGNLTHSFAEEIKVLAGVRAMFVCLCVLFATWENDVGLSISFWVGGGGLGGDSEAHSMHHAGRACI